MNKLKLLSPIIGLGAVASGIIATSCATTTFDLEEFGGGWSPDETSFFKRDVDLSASVWYTANVDVSKSSVIVLETSVCYFMVLKFDQGFEVIDWANIIKAEIYDKTKQLQQIYTSDVGKDQFYINTTLEGCDILIGAGTVTETSNFKIKFQIKENVKKFDLAFTIDDK